MEFGRQATRPGGWWRLVRGPLVVIAVVAVVGYWYYQVVGIRLSPPERSPLATSLRLVGPYGQEVSLDSFRGRVVVLNAWASWCPPCRAEVPRLNRLAASWRDDLVVVGVNVEGLADGRLELVRTELGMDYLVTTAPEGFSGAFAWNGMLPYTWLIDRHGRVRAEHEGLPAERSLRSACEKLVLEE